MKRVIERTLEQNLQIFLEKSQKVEALSIKEILDTLSGKGRFVILILLSLPFCQPIQIPGLSTPFGLFIAFIGIRMAFSKRIWLPKWLLSKNISSAVTAKITRKTLKIIKKLRPFIRPRIIWLCNYRALSGLLLCLLGIFLALPMPIPFTNFFAGWAILLLSIGLLESDSLFFILGCVISLVTICFFIFILFSIKIFLRG